MQASTQIEITEFIFSARQWKDLHLSQSPQILFIQSVMQEDTSQITFLVLRLLYSWDQWEYLPST